MFIFRAVAVCLDFFVYFVWNGTESLSRPSLASRASPAALKRSCPFPGPRQREKTCTCAADGLFFCSKRTKTATHTTKTGNKQESSSLIIPDQKISRAWNNSKIDPAKSNSSCNSRRCLKLNPKRIYTRTISHHIYVAAYRAYSMTRHPESCSQGITLPVWLCALPRCGSPTEFSRSKLQVTSPNLQGCHRLFELLFHPVQSKASNSKRLAEIGK